MGSREHSPQGPRQPELDVPASEPVSLIGLPAAERREALPSVGEDPQDRFVERAPLGAGATGTVVRAFDRARRHEVALKYLHDVDPDALYHFKREFRSLCGVVHPNLVTLHELFLAHDRWVVAMELVEDAQPFLDYVRPYRHWLRRPSGLATPSGHGSSSSDASEQDDGRGLGDAPDDVASRSMCKTAGITLGATVDLVGSASTPSAEAEPSGVPSRRMAIITAQLNFGRLSDAMLQLASGLEVVHRHQMLHRDLKPSNVLVDRSGRVVICDFGLVAAARSQAQGIQGTPAYMSPEQASQQPLTIHSDLYSVGVMLYEALTGQLPISGSSSAAILSQKDHADVVAPRTLNPDVPLAIEQLCLGLLERDPQRRPGLDDIRAAFSPRPMPSALGELENPAVPRFVGRAREREALRRAFADAREGQTVGVAITGPSGSGKSALMAATCEQLRAEHEALVFSGRCYQSESVPFKAVDAVVDAIANHLASVTDDAAAALLPSGAELTALSEMFPVLRRATAVAQAIERHAKPVPPNRLPSLAQAGLRSLAGAIARERPVVIAIDDLQWGDLDSEPLLRELIEGSGSPGLLVLIACRDDAESATATSLPSELLEALARPSLGVLDSHRDLRTLALEPLADEDATRLAMKIMGDRSAPSAELERLLADAGGHPMFVIELAHALRTGERLADLDGLDALIDRRIDALPAAERRLVEAVATSAQPQPLSVLSHVLELDREASTLAGLLAARMIRIVPGADGERLTTYHDRVREVAVARLSPKQRRRLHRKIAQGLEASPALDFEALTHHWAGAEDERRASYYAHKAGDRSLANRAYRRAAEHYQRVLAYSELDAAVREEVELQRARALELAGKLRAASALYQRIADRREPEAAAQLRGRALICMFRSGDMAQAVPLIKQAGRSLGVKIPGSKYAMFASLLWGRLALAIRPPRVRGFRDPEAIDPRARQQLDITQKIATALAHTDTVGAFAIHTGYVRTALKVGDPAHIAYAMSLESSFVAFLRGYRKREDLETMLRESMDAARVSGSRAVEAYVLGLTAICDYFSMTRLQDAAQTLDTAVDGMEQEPEFQWLTDALIRLAADARGLAGSFAAQSVRLPAQLERVRESGNESLRDYLCRGTSLWVYLAHDRPEQGMDLLTRAEPPPTPYPTLDALCYGNTRINFDMYRGRRDEAFSRASRLWKFSRSSMKGNLPMFNCATAANLGHLSVVQSLRAGQDRARHLARARQMVGQLRRRHRVMPSYVAGHRALLLAMLAAVEGDLDRTATNLRDAIREFDECQIYPHSMPARVELGRLIGGDEGDALRDTADRWMTAEGIANRERFMRWQSPIEEILTSRPG